MPPTRRLLTKYRMTENNLKQLALILSQILPADPAGPAHVRAYYAADKRVPDWEQRLAVVAANNRVLKHVAMTGDDWLIVAAMTSNREEMINFLDAVQELAPGQPGDPPLEGLRTEVG
jgi:hypothetical protein